MNGLPKGRSIVGGLIAGAVACLLVGLIALAFAPTASSGPLRRTLWQLAPLALVVIGPVVARIAYRMLRVGISPIERTAPPALSSDDVPDTPPTIFVKVFKARSAEDAAAQLAHHARELARAGYVPLSQSWADGPRAPRACCSLAGSDSCSGTTAG